MTDSPFTPDKEQIAALEPFERLPLERIELIATGSHAERAIAELAGATMLGFDTESKPTFAKGEVSDGPHIVQLATLEKAWIFQLHDADCRAVLCELLATHAGQKVGFGLGDDMRRIRGKLGVEARGVVDLNHLFRAQGYRKDIGVKTAVALLFGKRFLKSGKASTSNWAARQLSESQLLYAANDAWAAARVYEAMNR
ncbi:3'-5' exonuclease [Rhizobacter sp. Root404]|jgi:ribonuclease D|uniref:3'-5' exonuclease n=1 Tax=Rhizobacter sp. Root404 TaxID=1736528 RepID=UPI0007015AE3|nr:3'-5' exonuclease [Rhizobacter sp. Root404]KQW37901.1 3'-5' exonuclease [Rhizobacter sp. Root404]